MTATATLQLRALRHRLSAKWWVVILLLPLVAHGTLWFGPRAGLVVAAAVALCVAASVLPRVAAGQPWRLLNPGTLVTGLLLGLTLSAETPIYMIVVGALVAEIPAKLDVPGLGRNLLNPAATGRAAVALLELIDPPAWADLATGSSPLFKDAGGRLAPDALSMLFGMGPGAIGETHGLLLAMVAVPMLIWVALNRDAAITMLLAVPLLVLVAPTPADVAGHAPWVMAPTVWVFGGPTLLYAVFFLTDPRTTPSTRRGAIAFGLGVALIGVLGRLYTTIPGPEMWGILLMNVVTAPLDLRLSGRAAQPKGRAETVARGANSFINAARLEEGRLADVPETAGLTRPTEAFAALRAVLRAGDPDAVVREVQLSGLTGCGGGHFPAARKWQAALAHPGPRVLLVNAQEGEPGTAKDRYLVQHHADQVLEGAMIAGYAIRADEVIVVVDPAFAVGRAALEAQARQLAAEFGDLALPVTVRDGPGLYVCGEETALIAFLEGGRAEPRPRPPHPTEQGLNGRPTVTHNVETLYWVSELLGPDAQRAERFARKLVTVTGAVRRPGVYEATLGAPLGRLVDLAGGLSPGAALGAFALGGPTGALLPPSAAGTPLDAAALREAGADLGTGSVRVLSSESCLVGETLESLRFHADASCGRCTPCRVGTAELLTLVGGLAAGRNGCHTARSAGDVSTVLETASTCGLGRAAPRRLRSLTRYWPDLLAAHGRDEECTECPPSS